MPRSERLRASCLDIWSGFAILLKQEEEKTFDGRERKERRNGESRGPGNVVPFGPIDHGEGRIHGIVKNVDQPPDSFAIADEFVVLKANESAIGVKFDDRQIYVASPCAGRNKAAARTEQLLLKADDSAFCSSSLEEQMHVGLSCKVDKPK